MERRDEPLSFDEAISAVADPRRRSILRSLLRAQSLDGSATGVPTDDGNPVLLHHVHLPKLAALGVVRHDEEQGAVTRGPAFDEIRPMLALLDEHRDELPPGW